MGNYRLNPSLFSTRYLHLRELKKHTLRLLDRYNPQGRDSVLLDFGCGDMPYREVIEPRVGRYVGVDLKMNPKAEHHIDFDSKTTLPGNYADIVLSNQVLEHVDSPQGYLREARRLLKPDGIMVLSTHGYWFYHPTPNDYWRWTSAGLKKTVEAEGFELLEFTGVMGLIASGLQLFQDGVANKLSGVLKSGWALLIQTLIRLADKMNSQAQKDRDASLYIMVLRKRKNAENGDPA